MERGLNSIHISGTKNNRRNEVTPRTEVTTHHLHIVGSLGVATSFPFLDQILRRSDHDGHCLFEAVHGKLQSRSFRLLAELSIHQPEAIHTFHSTSPLYRYCLTIGPRILMCFLHISPSRAIRPFLKKRPRIARVPLCISTCCTLLHCFRFISGINLVQIGPIK